MMGATMETRLPATQNRKSFAPIAKAKADVAAGHSTGAQPGQPSDVPPILRKAGCACGGSCPRCQAKAADLKVSQPHDPAEIEADQIADKVMRMPDKGSAGMRPASAGAAGLPNHPNPDSIHRKCSACEMEDDVAPTIERKEGLSAAAPTPPPADTAASIRNTLRAGGHALDPAARHFFEPRFGFDLSGVRVHTDSAARQSARAINARAYTLGNNIAFADGEYSPGTDRGRQLLAHELAHVAQRSDATAFRSAAVGSETIHRVPGDLDDMFESPSADAGSAPASGSSASEGCPRVPTNLGDVEPEPSCPKATHIGTNEVARFNFCLDSDQLTSPGDLSELAKIVSGNHAKTRFLIHGYASPEGRVKYNFNLACHRANRVAEALHEPIRAQVRARMPNAGSERINTETGAEIQSRIETASQGPTSAFGTPEANRLAIVYAQIPNGPTDEEPSCADARPGIGNIKPELAPDLATIDVATMERGPHLTHFHFCRDSDVLAAETPADVRKFAQAQASKATFVVHGFSSEEGDADYNWTLSHHRALRIARELMNAGVRPEQIREVSAKGETSQFGDAGRNRVAVVLAEGGEVDAPKDGKRPADTAKQKQAVIDEARQRLISGQYNLAADTYISFWTCGRTRTISQAVERLNIGLPLDDANDARREVANGTEEGFGVNTVRMSNVALRANNQIECTMGRLVDMSFHHSVLENPDLPRDLTRVFNPNARPDDPINHPEIKNPDANPQNKDARHQAGLHLIHLAGLGACEGRRTETSSKTVGIDKPLEKDPRAGFRAPACAEAPQSTRLHFPTAGAKDRVAPFFGEVKASFTPGTGKLKTNFDPESRNKPANLVTAPEKDILTATAKGKLTGDPDTFADYEVGFIQSVIADETQADYSSGHSVIQALPAPIRMAAIKGDVPVPAPWTTLDAMAIPTADGTVSLSTFGIKLNSEVAIGLHQLGPSLPNGLMEAFEHSSRIAVWLVARRRGAPLDRFSVHFIDGVMYDLTQICHFENRHVKGILSAGGGIRQTVDPSLGGEGEIPVFLGSFHASRPSELPADPSLMRFNGATASDINLINQIQKVINPADATEAAMGKPELTARVREILDNLDVFDSVQDAVAGTAARKLPRLGFDFIPLTITIPFLRQSGRVKTPDKAEIVVTVEGPRLGRFAAFHLAKALDFRLKSRSPGSDVVVRPSIIDGNGEFGNVQVNLPPLPRRPDAPVEEESDLTKRPDVLDNMAEAWACTELTKTPKFIMVGAREFARAYSMDRDKKLTALPSDRLAMGEEENGDGFTTRMPCAQTPDGVNLGSFHTHPEPDPIPPVPSDADKDYAKKCGGAQHYIVTDNRVFRISPDGTRTTPVNVTLPKVKGCHAANLEEIKVKKDDDDE